MFEAPQDGHARASLAPHSPQNLRPVSLSLPQLGQTIESKGRETREAPKATGDGAAAACPGRPADLNPPYPAGLAPSRGRTGPAPTLIFMEVIAGHANTDFDCFASMLACRRLYPAAVVALSGSLNRNVREFYRLHADEIPCVEAARLELDAISRLVCVEATNPARLGDLEAVARRSDVDVVLFDHHRDERPDWLPQENVVLSDDGALTTTLVGIIAEREPAVTALEATVFALGIHEDTGSLTYPTATQRDAEALAWCLRHGARQEMVSRYLHAPLGEDERALLDALLASLETHGVAGVELLVAAVTWPTYIDGVSNLAHKVVDLTDSRALVSLVEMEGRVAAVFRSRTPEVDMSVLARALGGAGHPQASSAMYHGTLDEARAAVLDALPQAVREPPTAAQVMSHPARFVSADDTVAHAMVLCQRHRQSGIQVGTPENLEGVVSREDLDKAIGHGLSHAPVKAIMGSELVTCSEKAPLAELARLVASAHAGRVPVRRDREVVGVVTRSDVLRALGGAGARGAACLRSRCGPGAQSVARYPAGLRRDPGRQPALRGRLPRRRHGARHPAGRDRVRSRHRGRRRWNRSRARPRRRAGRAGVPHEKFGTGVVRWPGGRVDVATTRTEFYDEPGALPAVEQAPILQDLHRRDFTINAMAVSLRGGLRPSRRSVRRAGRFALWLYSRPARPVVHRRSDPHLPRRPVREPVRVPHGRAHDGACPRVRRDGPRGELSSARLREELKALLSEEDVGDSVLRLDELGLAQAIHPRLAAGTDTAALLRAVDELRARYAPGEPIWRARLAVLARRLSADELYEWFARLKLRRRDADLVADAVAVAPRLPGVLDDASTSPPRLGA